MVEALVPLGVLAVLVVAMGIRAAAAATPLAGLRATATWLRNPLHLLAVDAVMIPSAIGLIALGYSARADKIVGSRQLVQTGADSWIYWIAGGLLFVVGISAVLLPLFMGAARPQRTPQGALPTDKFHELRDLTTPLKAGIEALRPIPQTGGWWLVRARITNDELDERAFTAQTDSIEPGETEDEPWPCIWQQNKRRDCDIPGESSATLKLYQMNLFPYDKNRFVLIPFDEGDQRCNPINVPGHETRTVLRVTSRGVSKTGAFVCGVDSENRPYFRRPTTEPAAVAPQPVALARLTELRADFHLLEANAPVRFGDLPTLDWMDRFEAWCKKVHAAIPEGRRDLHDAFTAPPPSLDPAELVAPDRPAELRRTLDQRKVNLDGIIAHLSSQLGL